MDKSSITLAQLRQIKSLAGLSDDQLAKFLDFVELVDCPQEAILFEEGQPGNCMYFILHGKVRLFSRKKSGKVVALKELGEGEAFGDIALFHGTTRTASVETALNSRLLQFTAPSLERLYAEHADLSVQFLQALTQSLGQMYSH
jgi:CRP/FNR family transcriptional regulator, cyclic AMP receptor protein